MLQKQLEDAVKAVLEDKKTLSTFATSLAKEIIKQKSNPSNLEEGLVKEHVIFSLNGSDTGTFMTAKEVSEEILGFKPDITIRPRIFGKALMSEASVTKDSSSGRVYLIEKVVKEITPELLDEITHKTDAKDIQVNAPEEVKADAKGNTLTLEDLNGMDLSELLEVNKSFEAVKAKKAKKMDADELRDKLIAFFELNEKVSEETEEKNVDVDLLIASVGEAEAETLEDYEEFLEDLSRSKLIKHINKFKMPIVTEEKTEEEIIESILSLMKENMDSNEEEEAEEKEEPKEEPKKDKKKKDKKKKKKDKKKKKK